MLRNMLKDTSTYVKERFLSMCCSMLKTDLLKLAVRLAFPHTAARTSKHRGSHIYGDRTRSRQENCLRVAVECSNTHFVCSIHFCGSSRYVRRCSVSDS